MFSFHQIFSVMVDAFTIGYFLKVLRDKSTNSVFLIPIFVIAGLDIVYNFASDLIG